MVVPNSVNWPWPEVSIVTRETPTQANSTQEPGDYSRSPQKNLFTRALLRSVPVTNLLVSVSLSQLPLLLWVPLLTPGSLWPCKHSSLHPLCVHSGKTSLRSLSSRWQKHISCRTVREQTWHRAVRLVMWEIPLLSLRVIFSHLSPVTAVIWEMAQTVAPPLGNPSTVVPLFCPPFFCSDIQRVWWRRGLWRQLQHLVSAPCGFLTAWLSYFLSCYFQRRFPLILFLPDMLN